MKVAGRMPNKKINIIKYDATINKGKSSWIAFVRPQEKTDKNKITPAMKKRKAAKPLNPVYTFIILLPHAGHGCP